MSQSARRVCDRPIRVPPKFHFYHFDYALVGPYSKLLGSIPTILRKTRIRSPTQPQVRVLVKDENAGGASRDLPKAKLDRPTPLPCAPNRQNRRADALCAVCLKLRHGPRRKNHRSGWDKVSIDTKFEACSHPNNATCVLYSMCYRRIRGISYPRRRPVCIALAV